MYKKASGLRIIPIKKFLCVLLRKTLLKKVFPHTPFPKLQIKKQAHRVYTL